MAPRRTEQFQQDAVESEEDNSQPPSPENTMDKAKDIMSKYKRKREVKRKEIEEEHKTRADVVGRRLDELFKAKRSRVAKSQNDLWSRLDALNKRRQALEHTILTSMKNIEIHTLNLSSELIAMYEGRVDELNEMQTQEMDTSI